MRSKWASYSSAKHSLSGARVISTGYNWRAGEKLCRFLRGLGDSGSNLLSHLDAVGNTDTVVGVSHNMKSWKVLHHAFDDLHEFGMTDVVLGHRFRPVVLDDKQRLGRNTELLSNLSKHVSLAARRK